MASVDLSKRPFVIKTNTSALTAHALIVSTGADSRWLGAPGEDMYRGGGVSSCATCDGFLWREKHCAVIGGGDTAMEDALVLARTSSHVTLIHRRDSFRASHVLQQAVLGNPKITVLWNTTVGEFKGGDCASEATCMLSHLALHTTGHRPQHPTPTPTLTLTLTLTLTIINLTCRPRRAEAMPVALAAATAARARSRIRTRWRKYELIARSEEQVARPMARSAAGSFAWCRAQG